MTVASQPSPVLAAGLSGANRATASMPLYVDLDGSLIQSDLLIESALKLLKRGPIKALRMLVWLSRGKAFLKAQIAERIELDVASLPYNAELLQLIVQARTAGRRVVLATASHLKYAQAVSDHLRVFDGVIASSESINLSGDNKLAAIAADANGPFEYVGNEGKDLRIWSHAAAAVVVTSSRSLVERAQRVTDSVRHLNVSRPGLLEWLRAIRIHQWAKNLLLFMPAMPLLAVLTVGTWVSLLWAFACFGLCASSVYLLNDLLDLDADRAHARKRHRPLASGRIPLARACAAFPLLLGTAFGLAVWRLPGLFVLVLAVYWVATMAYSFELKRRILVDIMALASLYTMRILAGSAVLLIPPSFWILVFSLFLFLSLAAAKRFVELLEAQQQAGNKVAGRGYGIGDIPFVLVLGTSSGLISVMIFALYLNDPASRAHLQSPYALWLMCPLLLYWIARVWLKATRSELHHDPVVFAVTDRISQIIGLLCAALVAVAILG